MTTKSVPVPTFEELMGDAMDRAKVKGVREFATRLGLSHDTVYSWLRGVRKPDIDAMQKISKLAKIPLHEIVYSLEPEALGSEILFQAPKPVVEVPVRIAGWAGAGPDQYTEIEREVYVEEALARGRDLIAFKIFGNSMEGGKQPINDGSIVIVNQYDKSLNTFAVVARIAGDGYVCKKPLLSQSGRLQQLVSTNLEYDDPQYRIIDPSRVDEIVGRVIRVITDTP